MADMQHNIWMLVFNDSHCNPRQTKSGWNSALESMQYFRTFHEDSDFSLYVCEREKSGERLSWWEDLVENKSDSIIKYLSSADDWPLDGHLHDNLNDWQANKVYKLWVLQKLLA